MKKPQMKGEAVEILPVVLLQPPAAPLALRDVAPAPVPDGGHPDREEGGNERDFLDRGF